LKGVIARRTIQQVVAAERTEFLGEVLKIAGANVGGLGMTMIDVRVKSIGLPIKCAAGSTFGDCLLTNFDIPTDTAWQWGGIGFLVGSIALILAHLDPAHVAAIIREFEPALGGEVMFRIARMEKVSPDMIALVERALGSEADLAPVNNDQPFEIQLKKTGKTFTVPADKSILAVLKAEGVRIKTLCSTGRCGTCRVTYLSGEVDHRDDVLDDDEKGEVLQVCVSRAKPGQTLVLDL
jgi:ferredoxin